MKLQAIKKACLAGGVIDILNTKCGAQWICNGEAAWPVEGIKITESNVGILFDLTEKQDMETPIRETEWKDPRFPLTPMAEDVQLEDLGDVLSNGKVYKALRDDGGVLFIDTAWLKPAAKKDANWRFFERTTPGRGPIVAAFCDMLAGAIIMPVTGEGIMEALVRIAREPLRALGTPAEEKPTAEQTSL